MTDSFRTSPPLLQGLRRPGRTGARVAAFLVAVAWGCTDAAVAPDASSGFQPTLALTIPGWDLQGEEDAIGWRIIVVRPPQEVVKDTSGVLPAGQTSTVVPVSVPLRLACESFGIRVDLSSGTTILYSGELVAVVCRGSDNTAPELSLAYVGPFISLSVPAMEFVSEWRKNPSQQTFSVTNTGGGTLAWTASDDAPWLQASPASGLLGSGQSQSVSVIVSSQALAPGDYQGTISVGDPNIPGSPPTLPVHLRVNPGPVIGLLPSSLSFSVLQGADPAPRSFLVTNTGGGTLKWQATSDVPWLSVEPVSGSLSAGQARMVTVTVTSAEMEPGLFDGVISVADPDAMNTPRTLPVGLQVIPRTAPVISDLGVYLLTLNDPTCGNKGTRYEIFFDYLDPDGDIALEGDSLAGEPIELTWAFLPAGLSGSALITAGVTGNSMEGRASFQACIAFQARTNTSVDETITLRDSFGLWSNTLSTNIPRPLGGNSPAQGVWVPGGSGGGGAW